jgi:hypothetical protein
MRMSHVYQPLLIRTLLDAGGKATIRQIAKAFATEDEVQIRFYEKKIKEMPLRVLRKHEIADDSDGVITLNLQAPTFEERAELRAACERKIAEFLAERGIDTWGPSLDNPAIGESLRFKILKRDRHCQLCGATPKDTHLHVDHIVPRSKGGTNDESNLQVMCVRCNWGKSNRDDTDFREES